MKTNKFENTIRRKLESIQPDFQEQDWAKMQQYMQAHTPPTFWQQYGSWIGYAAAASVSTVMAFLYVNQLSQNNHLVADVKTLKNQIEVIQKQPAPTVKTDTIYVVQKEPVVGNRYLIPETHTNLENLANGGDLVEKGDLAEVNSSADDKLVKTPGQFKSNSEVALKPSLDADKGTPAENRLSNSPGDKNTSDSEKGILSPADLSRGKYTETVASKSPEVSESKSFVSNNQGNLSESMPIRVLGGDFMQVTAKNGVGLNNGYNASRKMNYELANRLSTKYVQRSLIPVNAAQAANNPQTTKTQIARAPVSEKKVEQTAKAENVIPKLNLKVPYRFGGGINIEGNGQAKTVVGEVLIAKKFSITAGISWLKIKPMEFFTEKIFREKNRKDFKRSHPGEVPLAFDVYNIKVNPTLVQIPLTVAFRNDIKNNWAYYAGVGTNITIASKEKISFDCRAPNNEYFTQAFDKKTEIPAISSINFSMGLEKTWHPIVVQAEGYLYTYFKPLTPLSHSAGPGIKVKLLYQIGGKM